MAQTPEHAEVDPVASNSDSVTPIAPPIESAPRLSDVLRAGLTTGVTAGLLCWLLYGIGSLFGTDFDVRQPASSDLIHVAWYQVLLTPVVAALIFAAIGAALRGRRNCRRTTLVVGYLLAAVSLVPVVLQPDEVTWPTKIWLALFHIVTALLVVPQVARVVGDSDPAVTAGYRRMGLDAA